MFLRCRRLSRPREATRYIVRSNRLDSSVPLVVAVFWVFSPPVLGLVVVAVYFIVQFVFKFVDEAHALSPQFSA